MEEPLELICMFLDCGMKLEHPEETVHAQAVTWNLLVCETKSACPYTAMLAIIMGKKILTLTLND